MESSWKHADVFPVIARLIEQAYREHGEFVTAQEIATRLLDDSEERHLIEESSVASPNSNSFEWISHNMVAWFSQRITVGDSDWASNFERVKIDDCWAYRPTMQ